MFQWDAVDTSPDLGSQNVLKMAVWPNGQMESDREFSVAGFIFTFVQKYFFLIPSPPHYGSAAGVAPVRAEWQVRRNVFVSGGGVQICTNLIQSCS